MNALKFYSENVLKKEIFFWEIPRPKKQYLLPKVLGEDEVARLFNALPNLKHKAMLFTVYSAGLRVSEIAVLKIRDIDSSRMENPLNVTTLIRSKLTTPIRSKLTRQIRFKLTTP
jgi:site-specific recombinase XerD